MIKDAVTNAISVTIPRETDGPADYKPACSPRGTLVVFAAIYGRRGSNSRPSACEADVITTRPRPLDSALWKANQLTKIILLKRLPGTLSRFG